MTDPTWRTVDTAKLNCSKSYVCHGYFEYTLKSVSHRCQEFILRSQAEWPRINCRRLLKMTILASRVQIVSVSFLELSKRLHVFTVGSLLKKEQYVGMK